MRNKQSFSGIAFFVLFSYGSLNAQSFYIGPVGPDFNIPYEPEIITGLFSTGNIYATAMNIKSYGKAEDDPSNAGFYLISGVFQFSYGALFVQKERQDLKAINEIAGGAGTITSILRMVKPRKRKESISLIPYFAPTITGGAAGFHFVMIF
jgi:tryptophan-rich sensory protein